MNNNTSYWKYLVIGCLSILGMMLHKELASDLVLPESVDKINKELRYKEKLASKVLQDQEWEKLVKTEFSSDPFEKYHDKFNILVYKGDSLIYWLNTPEFNLPSKPQITESGSFIISNSNAFEFWTDQKLAGYTRQVWIPVSNNNLSIKSNSGGLFTEYPNNLPIFRKDGNKGLYLNEKSISGSQLDDYIRLILYLIGFLCFLFAINQAAIRFLNKYPGWFSSTFLLVNVFGLRFLSNYFEVSGYFDEIPIFNQSIHSKYLGISIGDFLLNGVVFLWVVIFWYKTYRQGLYDHLNTRVKWFIGTSNYFAILLGIIMITGIIKSIILESDIYFDFENVFNLSQNSLFAILGLMTVFITLFLFSQRLMFTINQLKLSKKLRITAILASLVFAYLFLLGIPMLIINIKFFLFGLLYLLLLDFYTDSESTDFTWLLIWLIIFSSFSAALLYTFNQNKEEKRIQKYAKVLANPRDAILEDVYTNYLINNINPKESQSQRISSLLDDNYVKAYYQSVKDTSNIKQIKTWRKTQFPGLLWGIVPYKGSIHYKIDNENDSLDVELVTIPIKEVFDFQYQAYNIKPYKDLGLLHQFSYTMYFRGKLVYQNHNPNFAFSLKKESTNTQNPQKFGELQYSALDPTGREIQLHKQAGGFIKILNLFSYLFVLLAFTILIFIAINTYFGIVPGIFYLEKRSELTLRSRIQISIISMIILSFLSIGTITIFYFRYTNKKAILETQLKKLSSIIELANPADVEIPLLKADFGKIANELQTELLVYNEQGLLIQSNPAVLGKINPGFHLLPKAPSLLKNGDNIKSLLSSVNNENNIGMVGSEIRSNDGISSGYIAIPNYGSQPETKSQIADFIGALINTYVFLLLIASALALVVGRSITSPLLALGEKLKRLKFGRQNEALKWENADEIGALVFEYNQMILKLEDSANLLAKSERENAWREMAQQVAHEIKNPLTPMKLNVQYLLHSFHSDPDNLEKRIKNICNVLIQQIDNLSQIAGEFNNFAKEPQINNERLELNGIVKGVVALFEKAAKKEVKITKEIPQEALYVMADKSHLIRIFNNLINNAIQALKEDTKGNIHVTLKTKDNYAIIIVQDNGTGISKEKAGNIFMPNFTTKSGGSGLGLAISKKLIESMDGDIYFESIPDQGTSFFVTIPLITDELNN